MISTKEKTRLVDILVNQYDISNSIAKVTIKAVTPLLEQHIQQEKTTLQKLLDALGSEIGIAKSRYEHIIDSIGALRSTVRSLAMPVSGEKSVTPTIYIQFSNTLDNKLTYINIGKGNIESIHQQSMLTIITFKSGRTIALKEEINDVINKLSSIII